MLSRTLVNTEEPQAMLSRTLHQHSTPALYTSADTGEDHECDRAAAAPPTDEEEDQARWLSGPPSPVRSTSHIWDSS